MNNRYTPHLHAVVGKAMERFFATLMGTPNVRIFVTQNPKFVKAMFDDLMKNIHEISASPDILDQHIRTQFSVTTGERVQEMFDHFDTFQRLPDTHGKCFEDWLIGSGRMNDSSINEQLMRRDAETTLQSVPSIFRNTGQIVNGVEHKTDVNHQLQNPGLTDLYYAEAANDQIVGRATPSRVPTTEELNKQALFAEFSGPSIAQLLIDESARITQAATAINREGGNTRSMRISALSNDSIRRGEYFHSPLLIDFTSIPCNEEIEWAFNIVKAHIRDNVSSGKIDAHHALAGLREIAATIKEIHGIFDEQQANLVKEYAIAFKRYADQLAKVTNRLDARKIYNEMKAQLTDLKEALDEK